MTHKGGEEILEEKIVKLEEHADPLIKLFLRLMKTMPELDSITAQKRLKSEGSVKRLIDMFRAFTSFNSSKETLANNIFAPTATL